MKKIISVIICILIIFSFSGCGEEERPDFELLSTRLTEINEKYGFDFFNMFFYDDAYRIYLSLASDHDVLLTMTFGENSNIDTVTVTAVADALKNENAKAEFSSFCAAVISSFASLSDADSEKLYKETDICTQSLYFTNIYQTFETMHYSFVFSSDSQSLNLYCKYIEYEMSTG